MDKEYRIILNKEEEENINIQFKNIVDRLSSRINFTENDYLFLYWNSGSSPTLTLFEKYSRDNWERVSLMFDIKLLRMCSNIYKIVDKGRIFAMSIYIFSDGSYEYKLYDDLNPKASWSNLYLIAYKEYDAKLPILNYTGTTLEKLIKAEDFKESLFYAVYHRDLYKVKEKINNNEIDGINESIKTIGTPLYVACKNGDYEIVKLLIKAGAEIDLENYIGKSPLLESINHGHEDVARYLIEEGADINKKSIDNNGALELAIVNNLSLDFIRYLITKGCNIEKSEIDGIDLLSIAVHKKDTELINLLVNSKMSDESIKKALTVAEEEVNIYNNIIKILSNN